MGTLTVAHGNAGIDLTACDISRGWCNGSVTPLTCRNTEWDRKQWSRGWAMHVCIFYLFFLLDDMMIALLPPPHLWLSSSSLMQSQWFSMSCWWWLNAEQWNRRKTFLIQPPHTSSLYLFILTYCTFILMDMHLSLLMLCSRAKCFCCRTGEDIKSMRRRK